METRINGLRNVHWEGLMYLVLELLAGAGQRSDESMVNVQNVEEHVVPDERLACLDQDIDHATKADTLQVLGLMVMVVRYELESHSASARPHLLALANLTRHLLLALLREPRDLHGSTWTLTGGFEQNAALVLAAELLVQQADAIGVARLEHQGRLVAQLEPLLDEIAVSHTHTHTHTRRCM